MDTPAEIEASEWSADHEHKVICPACGDILTVSNTLHPSEIECPSCGGPLEAA